MRVYIHCTDGKLTCGPLVLGCFYWLREEPKFDPLEWVHDGRKLRFLLCRAKPQRQQLDLIKEYAKKTSTWEQVGVVKRLKLGK